MTAEGASAFDFLHGRWVVHNHKLRDVTDPECTEWVDFDATSEISAVLLGGGNIDRMYAANPPDGEPFEGLTLRIYDPATDEWSIWWSSTRAPGKLDEPVRGRFVDGVGVFDCTDVIRGETVIVRFRWSADGSTPEWRQFFSRDGGASWTHNWTMSLERA